ncbi:MAG: alginate O-acetyltransferase complex protein AlgI [Sphingobacteriales bacterium]|jgi:alginate O-acetyltransferase complex protein AlgI
MLFNSIEFALFLPLVFCLYWLLNKKNIRAQNILLLGASYFFYGWWDWRFLILIVISSVLDYGIGLALKTSTNESKRKALLGLSIAVNLGFLGFFKYFNFFSQSFADAYTLLGTSFNPLQLNIILPVGISFYTFQTLSYTIDVYRKKLEPTSDLIAFFTYVSFFPQLVAGPIERATNLLPQFKKERTFSFAQSTDGLRQILWGLFKKIVIADNCAVYVTDVFANYAEYQSATLMLAAVLFAFQIYCDFSGYSDIAIGTARLFGFNLMRNFAFPYFSRDIAEFWRRWHISLSTWFRDYLYIPIGGSRGSKLSQLRNVFIIFLVSGFWHGANWTFLAWGFINACLFIPLLLLNLNRNNLEHAGKWKYFPSPLELGQIILTFSFTCLAWIFFRSESIASAFEYIARIFTTQLTQPAHYPASIINLTIGLIIVEWVQRKTQHGLDFSTRNIPLALRYSIYLILVFAIYFLGNFSSNYEFIYFQF